MSLRTIQRRHERLRNAICRNIEHAVNHKAVLNGSLLYCQLSNPVPLDIPVLTSRRKVIGVGDSYHKGLCANVVSVDRNEPYQIPIALIPTDVLLRIYEHLV